VTANPGLAIHDCAWFGTASRGWSVGARARAQAMTRE